MKNKVLIAAAGRGTRMLHLTKNKSKHLIKVCQNPFLCYLLRNISEAGYRDIILVVGHKGEKFQEFFENCKKCAKCDIKIRILDQYKILGKDKYGTACPLMCAEKILKNESFLYVCGDNLYSVKDLKAMVGINKYNYVAGLVHKNPEKYGVLITDNVFLKRIIEKPKEYVGNLINTGMYKFTPEVFEKLPELKKSPRGEYEITDVISSLAKEGKVKIKKIEDYWLDFGNPGDIIKISRFLNGNRYKKSN